MSKIIYCISGLGADHRAFKNLHLDGYELRPIPWLRPLAKENVEDYAKRLRKIIEHPSPIIIGLSFGGMIGIEMAKQIHVKRLFIVSSIKSKKEMPGWMKIAGKLELHKILPTGSNKITEKKDNERLGVSTEEELELVQSYRKSSDQVYMNWAIDRVLKWKNDWLPEHIIHIHGDKDKIFPIKKIKPDYIIKDGTHMMIYNRANEIAGIIQNLI
jgi:pimeloyl-ACP methyl ester carboxylesterase